MRSVLEGAVCIHCEHLHMSAIRCRLSVFSRVEGQASAHGGWGPSRAEAERRLRSWGSPSDSAARESHLLDENGIFFSHPLDQQIVPFWLLARLKSRQWTLRIVSVVSEPSRPLC